MAKRTRIAVTQDHINRGVRSSGNACAIALAVHEMFSDADIDVDDATISVYDFNTGKDIAFGLPQKASNFIHAFDDGEAVQPFSFWTL